jgi:pimeloyl-ACP methyl ester carboxylesterase
MTRKIYCLLIGIDNYHPDSRGVNSLNGCLNDIESIETYLRKRIASESGWELVETSQVPWKLTNGLATRKAIIDGFQQHLCNADSEDVVLFYYAGHGSYEPAPEAFWTEKPDRKMETLVCYDSRTEAGQDLADKELNYLIEQVASKNPHILIILDCCHSGTATRDPEVSDRQTPTNGRVRNLQDFIFTSEWLNHRLSDNYQPPRHIAIAACRSHQKAKEYTDENGKRRGAFSHFLTQSLQRTNGNLSYVDLVQDINTLLTGKVKDQSPQIEAPPEDLRQSFLGGAIGERVNYFTLTYDSKTHHSWVINAGALHGVRLTSEGEILLAVFQQGITPEELRQISHRICRAKVTQVLTEVSQVELSSDQVNLSQEIPYWAVVTDVPLPRLKVYFQGDDVGIEQARQVLLTTDSSQPSLFVREAESSEDANYYLEATNGQYWIRQPADKHPLVAPVPEIPDTQGYTRQNANTIIRRLEHIARWTNILELKTPPTSQIKPGDVEMEILVTSGERQYSSQENSGIRGEYTFKNDKWEPPRIEVKVTNNSEQELYFQLIELAGNYEIDIPQFFTERSSLRLPKRGSDGASVQGERLKLIIPRDYLSKGITEYNTIFKLIVSTRDFNASLLQQPGLDLPCPINRSGQLSGAFNRLMNKIYTRQTEREEEEYIDNWMSQEVKINLFKPPAGKEIRESEAIALLSGVELQGHANFKGKFSFTGLPPISRDVNSNLIPPILLQSQTAVHRDGSSNLTEPYEFNMTRSPNSFSILEVTDIENHQSVTPDNPIKLVIDRPLAPDEHVLPIAYDGEFFIPLGKAKRVNGKTEITLERLPEPIVDSRSLQGSIKILFQKLLSPVLRQEFNYPLVRIAEVSTDGRVSYQDNRQVIRSKIDQAKKILLFIHGIIGDTKSLVPSVQQATFTEDGQQKTLQDRYDLILACDYENLHTTIEENAKLLKQRLEEIGLGANHGKQLHIVAHSMGGLVSRTLIEREGGNQIVQHLVMLGTPNAGSPWPSIQDWAFAALGIGLNQMSSIAWPTIVIAGLVAFLEASDNALDQMNPQSPFISSIANNPDPNVQYTIIAGDRSIRQEALETDPGKQSSQIQRLLRKLFSPSIDTLVNIVFLNQPNDIAVTLESIKSVSTNCTPQPIILPDSACDHLTYFTSESGLSALAQALRKKS